MAAEAALQLPEAVLRRPPAPVPPEQPRLRLVIEPANQLKVSVTVLAQRMAARRGSGRPASARLRQHGSVGDSGGQ